MIKRVHTAVLLAICWLVCPQIGQANNLRLFDLGLQDRSTLSVTLSWENAWNLPNQAPSNHDAAWLFVKVKENGIWKTHHLSNVEGESHAVDAGMVRTEAVADGMGLFVRPDFEGSGAVTDSEIILRLEKPLGSEVEEVQVFGIEMVWVSNGEFWMGDGASVNALRRGDGPTPYMVVLPGELPVGSDAGSLDSTDEFAPKQPIPTAFPNGFDGFYCMKYEISQAQYVDFLNSLTAEQQVQRTVSGPGGMANALAMTNGQAFRNGLRVFKPGSGNVPAVFACDGDGDGQFDGPADGQNRACNFLNWADVLAYLDWSGLSPMTEFEFEKAARGSQSAVPLEFAWGTPQVEDANTLLLDGRAGESVVEIPTAPTGLASHGYDGPQGPLRCGFGGQETSTRLTSGAGYYGIFELSGNLWEVCVSVNEQGLYFEGRNGDGELDVDGTANEFGWPSALGGIYRGGGWNSGILPGFRDLAVSDRFYADQAPNLRRNTVGGRGVRR